MPPLSAGLRAADVMSRSLIVATPDQDLLEAERALLDNRISGMPVVEDGRLVGVLSASDIARVQLLMNSLDGQVDDRLDWPIQADGFQHSDPPPYHGFRHLLDRLKVKDAMHDQVIVCHAETPVAEVARTMAEKRIHRLIVVEGDHPVGIVSSLDLVKVLADSAAS